MEALPGALTPAEARDAGAPGAIRTFSQATTFLESLLDVEKRPDVGYARLGLEPVQRLLSAVGNPHHALSVVHITGSKGKGSTSLLVESMLRAAGERVASFTSPHLERWTERFRIDGQEVEEDALAATVERLRPHVERLRRDDPAHAPTFFDATTAAAFLLFRDAKVDRAVIEVGLGGRLDSTNVVDPAITCVTTVELEHTDRLGTTRAAIAAEKAGIVKPGRPLVTGDLHPEARAVVEARARKVGAPLARLGRDFSVEIERADADGLALRLADGGCVLRVETTLLGAHQATNLALAAAIVRRLATHDENVLRSAIRAGAKAARLPARVEVLGRRPWRVVDGAHTEESARALANALALMPRRRTCLVLSVSAGKNLSAILDALLPTADQVIVTCAEATRSMPVAELAAVVARRSPTIPVRSIESPLLALRTARESVGPDDLLLATGSIYLAGIARGEFVRGT